MPPIRRNRNTAVERVADTLGLSFAALGTALGISRWTPGWWNKTTGVIPKEYHPSVRKLARRKKVRVSKGDLG